MITNPYFNVRQLKIVISLLFLVLHGIGRADDWPQFLGINRDGKSNEKGILTSWPESGPKRIWDFDCGTGYSAPSVIGDKIVLHHRVGDHEIVRCMNVQNGEKVWEYKYPSKFIDPYGYNNGPRCTPILTEDFCYTFGAEGMLLCLDIRTGKPIWQNQTQNKWKVPEAFFGVGSTPLLDGETLFVMVGGQPNSGMIAFNSKSGDIIWESVGKNNWEGQPLIGWPGKRKYKWKGYEKVASYSSPVVADIHGKKVLFAFMRQGLVGINPKNGQVHFSSWFQSRVPESVNAINPIVRDNQVFISSCYYRQGSVVINLDEQINVDSELWRGLGLEVHFTTPILHEGNLYAFSGRNPSNASFRCVDWDSGKIRWQRDESLNPYDKTTQNFGRGSAILVDGHFIVLGETGNLALFKASPEKPLELHKLKIKGMDYPSWTAPIISNKKLYLRSEKKLICLDISSH